MPEYILFINQLTTMQIYSGRIGLDLETQVYESLSYIAALPETKFLVKTSNNHNNDSGNNMIH